MASATLNQELDSSFLKGLRLLHSSEPDAEEQLQQLWKQAVVDKYGSERTPTSVLHKIAEPVAVKRENQDVTNDAIVEAKRPKLENSVLPPPASTSPLQSAVVGVEPKDSSGDEASPLEILNSENVCKKCKTSTSSASDKLVECVDCHTQYHQACHFPPISDMDLSDPRFVWYCSSCDQNITTTTIDKTKAAYASSTNSIKSGNSSKGLAATSKSGRIHSANNKTSAQGCNISTNNKTTESNSKDTGASNASSTPEKKGHMMKKRSMKKLDKKKSFK